MHEASYAISIINSIMQHLGSEEVRVRKIKLKIGELTMIDPVALESAIQAYGMGTPVEGAKLEYEIVPAKMRCKSCGSTWGLKDVYPQLESKVPLIHMYPHIVVELLKCPKCGSNKIEIIQGEEFILESIEVDEDVRDSGAGKGGEVR